MTRIVLDGVLTDDARISVLDRGLLYGDGCFEVLRTWGGHAVDLAVHLGRMRDTARYLRLPEPHGLEAAVALALDGTEGEQRIRIVLTRGPGGLATRMADAGPGHAIVIAEPLGELPAEMSLAVVDYPIARIARRGHKTLAYLDHVIARELARDAGCDDALRLDADGMIAEGGTCNVFAITDAELLAPLPQNVLPGIVRGRILGVTERVGLPRRAGPISQEAFLAADEVFATSSLRGVVAVTRIVGPAGERQLPHGDLTRRITEAYVAEMTARSVI